MILAGGARAFQRQLKMLGMRISERTVCRILRTRRRPPTQTWKTFLHKHVGQLVSIDFFIALQRDDTGADAVLPNDRILKRF